MGLFSNVVLMPCQTKLIRLTLTLAMMMFESKSCQCCVVWEALSCYTAVA